MQLISCWSRTDAQILKSQIDRIQIDIGEGSVTGYQPRITFEYEFNGQRTQSSNLCPDPRAYEFDDYVKAQKFLQSYETGNTVRVFVSGNNNAVLLNEFDWHRKSHYFAVFLSGILIAAIDTFLWMLQP